MGKKSAKIFAVMAIWLVMITTNALAGDKLPQLGQGITIWFDTGGPVGGPYNTIVQNGAMQAASDLGAEVKYLYSDWNPEKVVENFKKSMAASPDGIVLMGLPGDDPLAPFIDEAFNKGITVTCVDTGLPATLQKYKSKGFGFIGTDYDQMGTSLAEESLRRAGLKKGDRAMIWGLKRLEDRGRRARAMIRTLKEAGIVVDYIEISPEVDKDSAMGTPIVTGYLSSHPDCKMMLIDHGALTSQTENFLRTAGIKPDEIFVGGFSLSPATATAIENGYVDLVSEMQPYLLGYLSVAQIVFTRKYGFTGLELDTGGGLVHKDNIGLVAPLANKGIR
ncbi:sugar ABC transporter substrate-binding protein [Desulforhopalus singaporensis]|uniref:Monosaccharide ABC transporter substrate-binding protein, CUT2 family (TC 3.A.1.2.-) n=1 Tax=Desulforhopalus singaporensis TaxID=91360 RepID=A0A1H0R2L3_9BACT|nr:substrate-binding domain-containing protein [Desulforhopalus singaporensis]SDP23635.1 monosaccharide ABC transporter substrate-binding protein, CUT2 family (TC 3.A.1.2.-) [Desulforhopalus singaporensis]